jgi:hypothetical protein
MVKYVVCSFLSFINAIKIGKILVVTFEANCFAKEIIYTSACSLNKLLSTSVV